VFETKVTLKQAIAANGTGVRRRVPEVARRDRRRWELCLRYSPPL